MLRFMQIRVSRPFFGRHGARLLPLRRAALSTSPSCHADAAGGGQNSNHLDHAADSVGSELDGTTSSSSQLKRNDALTLDCPIPSDHGTLDSPWEDLSVLYRTGSSFNSIDDNGAPYPKPPQAIGGFLTKKHILSSRLAFATVSRESGGARNIRIVIDDEHLIKVLKKTRLHSAVVVKGEWKSQPNTQKEEPGTAQQAPRERREVHATTFHTITQAPERAVTDEDNLPAHERVLQMRFNPELSHRLRFRAFLQNKFVQECNKLHYTHITTPTLFKSTPEGAREFLVPTRTPGTAYALTQSPQQYKQALMAGGISAYMQFAPCWRDEDLRQDRQPEFMQLDLERAWVTSIGMKNQVRRLVRQVMVAVSKNFRWQHLGNKDISRVPVRIRDVDRDKPSWPYLPVDTPGVVHTPEIIQAARVREASIQSLTYSESMKYYGSDKPDLRVVGNIQDVTDLVSDEFKAKITSLEDAVIEAYVLRVESSSPATANPRLWIKAFMESLPPELASNPHGQPVLLGFDPTLPLNGFASLGPEGIEPLQERLFSPETRWEPRDASAENSEEQGLQQSTATGQTTTSTGSAADEAKLDADSAALPDSAAAEQANQEGEVTTPQDLSQRPFVLFQARPRPDPDVLWQGGSTALGDLRKRLWSVAEKDGSARSSNRGIFRFVFVDDMPLFRPIAAKNSPLPSSSKNRQEQQEQGVEEDPGQGGAAGIASAHHPFTAPHESDFGLLETAPLRARSQAFDLVLNGVEVGGGSARIHNALIQEAIMRRVLRMPDEAVERFRPLLDALRYAPPHAGFAFGFDRLTALLSGTSSIRDVVAFPKSASGEDPWARSPGTWTDEQLESYHLQRKEKESS